MLNSSGRFSTFAVCPQWPRRFFWRMHGTSIKAHPDHHVRVGFYFVGVLRRLRREGSGLQHSAAYDLAFAQLVESFLNFIQRTRRDGDLRDPAFATDRSELLQLSERADIGT